MHPLAQFKFCPRCGSNQFEENDFKSKKCLNCNFVYYFNSCAAVAAFITDNEGRLLVARRANEPAKGTFDLPGGFIDLDETAEEALIREIMEETGLIVQDLNYQFSIPNIYVYSGFDVHTVDFFFECRVDDITEIHAKDDVEELLFIHKNEIDPQLFGFTSMKTAIKYWLKQS